MLHPMEHADALQRGLHAALAIGRLQLAIGQRQLDVLRNSEITDEIERLKDETDLPVADARSIGESELLYCFAGELVTAGRRRVEKAQQRQQRRLPAAR